MDQRQDPSRAQRTGRSSSDDYGSQNKGSRRMPEQPVLDKYLGVSPQTLAFQTQHTEDLQRVPVHRPYYAFLS
jgi:hypothetical protein